MPGWRYCAIPQPFAIDHLLLVLSHGGGLNPQCKWDQVNSACNKHVPATAYTSKCDIFGIVNTHKHTHTIQIAASPSHSPDPCPQRLSQCNQNPGIKPLSKQLSSCLYPGICTTAQIKHSSQSTKAMHTCKVREPPTQSRTLQDTCGVRIQALESWNC